MDDNGMSLVVSELSPHKLFSDVGQAKAAWQDQFDTACKSDSESVLSFYDFSTGPFICTDE